MRPKFKSFLILSFFALFVFTSCQDEITEITNPTEEQTIVANSQLATLMRSTSANDGSVDDVLDNANCLSINLPVTIVVNDITITINTLEDLELIEDLFEEFNNDEDLLEFLFPITIILDDYTEIVIENVEQLETFIEECTDEPEVIECIDFQYPISFSIFNSEFVIIDTVTINNDEELYEFLENLDNPNDANPIVSLNYPVTLEYANGDTIEVNSNEALSEAISTAEDDCDDDDNDCTEEDVDMYLQECSWEIAAFSNSNNQFENLNLFFNEGGVLEILNGDTTQFIDGNWSTSLTDEGVILSISEVTEFDEALNGDWLITDCDHDEFELRKESAGTITEMVLEQECEDDIDCSAQEISMNLQECIWYAGTNLYDNVVAEEFHFGENGVVEVYNTVTNELTTTGSWSVSLTDEGVFVILDFDTEPFSLLSLSWQVVDCNNDRFELVNGDNYLVFEKDCEDDDLDCTEEDVSAALVECIWNIVNLNGSDDLIVYELYFEEGGALVISTDEVVIDSAWSLSQNDDGVWLEFSNVNVENIEEIVGSWLIIECESGELTMMKVDNYMVIEQDCD